MNKRRIILVPADGLWVECKILDTKRVYGTDRVLVQPVRGQGEVWINKSRIRPLDGGNMEEKGPAL